MKQIEPYDFLIGSSWKWIYPKQRNMDVKWSDFWNRMFQWKTLGISLSARFYKSLGESPIIRSQGAPNTQLQSNTNPSPAQCNLQAHDS